MNDPSIIYGFNPANFLEIKRSAQNSAGELSYYQDPVGGELVVPLQHVNLRNIHNTNSPDADRLEDLTIFLRTGWHFEVLPLVTLSNGVTTYDSPLDYLTAADTDRLAQMVGQALRDRHIPYKEIRQVIDKTPDRNTPRRSIVVAMYNGQEYQMSAGQTALLVAEVTSYDPVTSQASQPTYKAMQVVCDNAAKVAAA